MTPADKRVMELLDRWLISIELHLKYVDLDDARYQQVQPWPKHERPARWILELAQQKVLSLQTLCKIHRSDDDPSFAEAVELMCFLANLVGAQHIQRFIPVADPAHEQDLTHTNIVVKQAPVVTAPTAPIAMQVAAQTHAQAATPMVAKPKVVPIVTATAAPQSAPVSQQSRESESDRTREMPRLRPVQRRVTPHPVKHIPERRAHGKAPQAAVKPVSNQPAVTDANANEVVVADAIRLLKWGRQWHEIAELIARMAERPNIAEVRKILRTNKPAIDQQLEA